MRHAVEHNAGICDRVTAIPLPKSLTVKWETGGGSRVRCTPGLRVGAMANLRTARKNLWILLELGKLDERLRVFPKKHDLDQVLNFTKFLSTRGLGTS